jgi:pimeloyl-ACP methyl ester carboxylesterase
MRDSMRETGQTAKRPTEIWFASAGTRLFAVESGEGLPIVFLHGGLADHRASLFRVRPLTTSYRVITPDLRGSGRSVHAGGLSWDQLADDVDALLSHLRLERVVVGGVSAGSAVALRFALRHPARVRALVLIAPPYLGSRRGLTGAQRTAFRTMDAHGSRAPAEGIDVLRPLYERLPPATRELALAMLSGFDAASVAATTRFLASGVQPFDEPEELASIEVPALLVPGADPEHPADVCELYAQHLPNRVLVTSASPNVAAAIDELCRELDGP